MHWVLTVLSKGYIHRWPKTQQLVINWCNLDLHIDTKLTQHISMKFDKDQAHNMIHHNKGDVAQAVEDLLWILDDLSATSKKLPRTYDLVRNCNVISHKECKKLENFKDELIFYMADPKAKSDLILNHVVWIKFALIHIGIAVFYCTLI